MSSINGLPCVNLLSSVWDGINYHRIGILRGAYREPSGQAMVLLYVEQVTLNIFNQLDK